MVHNWSIWPAFIYGWGRSQSTWDDVIYPDCKVHGDNIGGRQDPGGPHVGPMNFAIWVCTVLSHWPRSRSVIEKMHRPLKHAIVSYQYVYWGWLYKTISFSLLIIDFHDCWQLCLYSVRIHKAMKNKCRHFEVMSSMNAPEVIILTTYDRDRNGNISFSVHGDDTPWDGNVFFVWRNPCVGASAHWYK